MSDVLEYYKVLGLGFDATAEEIKKQYRDLAKIWHPDHNKKDDAVEKFQHISVAYDVLSDEKSRFFYDVYCIAYKTKPAPDMKLLKVYKDADGKDDNSLRVLSVYKKGKLQKVICSEFEAKKEVLTSLLNIKNYSINLFDKDANLQMLLHNALAYNFEGNNQMALIYASQAVEFANNNEKEIIKKWVETFGVINEKAHKWNYGQFGLYKFLPLALFLFAALIFVSAKFSFNVLEYFKDNKKIEYYQKIEFADGRQSVDDVDLGKIINYPVDVYDDNMLYHFNDDVVIKYGPSENFDDLAQGVDGQTVRITGQTPDEIWLRVMIDDGQMGFVKTDDVKKGISNKIPENSKIVK